MTTIQNSEQLGLSLRAARKHLGMTQPELALAAGVGLRFLGELERGKRTVRFDSALRVIDALGGHIVLTGLPADGAGEE